MSKRTRRINLSPKKSVKARITFMFLTVALSIMILLAAVLYSQCYSMVTNDAAERVSRTAREAAKVIDVDEFVKLKSIEDEKTEPYNKMREALDYIRQVSGAKYVFTMRKTDDGEFIYVVDGSEIDVISHIGDVEEPIPAFETVWSGKEYTDKKIHHEENWGSFISSYYPLKDDKGNVVGFVGVDFDVETVYMGLNKLKNTTIIIILLFIAAIIVFSIVLANSITKHIKYAVEYSGELADLNLAKDVSQEYLERKDEFGEMARALNAIRNSFKKIILEINGSSEKMAAASQQFASISQESAAMAEEVASSVEEIAKGAADQAQHTEQGASQAVLLGNMIDKNAEYVKDINSSIDNVIQTVNEGLKEMDELLRINEESNIANGTIADVIVKTGDSSDKIGEASSFIESIAEQTNLLALNASIEAARAGEAGKGFAVVAYEIRKLADQSAESTHTIGQIIKELQLNVKDAVKAMEKMTQISNRQNKSVNDSKNRYKLIEEAMKECENAAASVDSASKEMADMKNEILKNLENLAAIAEENSAATEEVTASMEEQASAIQELAGSSEELSQLAQELRKTALMFKM